MTCAFSTRRCAWVFSPLVALLLLSACSTTNSAGEARVARERVRDEIRVAFGSCLDQERSRAILDAVRAASPDVFLFLGDNVYADTEDMDRLHALYDGLAGDPHYQSLALAVPILGTWDDHDYGENDAGYEYPQRARSQELFLDFLGVPLDSIRRQRDGVYHAELLPTKASLPLRVRIILLDTRYHRSPIDEAVTPAPESSAAAAAKPGRGPYTPSSDPDRTMLGDDQWRWLETELREPADLRVICSSVQVLADEHGWEGWANLPHERERLLALIRATGADGVVFLSGDRHHAEITRLEADPRAGGVGYPIHDLTSSSLNRGRGQVPEPNRGRVGEPFGDPNFGLIAASGPASDPRVRFEIRDRDGRVVIEHTIRLAELRTAR